jgi:hypothetical protein
MFVLRAQREGLYFEEATSVKVPRRKVKSVFYQSRSRPNFP